MNVGSIVFEPDLVFMNQVDHSIFFTPPPQPAATTGQPMQLYCYVKQLDDVRAFFRRLDISKHVYPLRGVWEIESLGKILRGQVLVKLWHPERYPEIPIEIVDAAIDQGMNIMDIQCAP